MAEGWTVRVDRANDYEPTTLFDVVACDSHNAEALVRAFADCGRNDRVRIVAPLTRGTIEAHELREGQVKAWGTNGKIRWEPE